MALFAEDQDFQFPPEPMAPYSIVKTMGSGVVYYVTRKTSYRGDNVLAFTTKRDEASHLTPDQAVEACDFVRIYGNMNLAATVEPLP